MANHCSGVLLLQHGKIIRRLVLNHVLAFPTACGAGKGLGGLASQLLGPPTRIGHAESLLLLHTLLVSSPLSTKNHNKKVSPLWQCLAIAFGLVRTDGRTRVVVCQHPLTPTRSIPYKRQPNTRGNLGNRESIESGNRAHGKALRYTVICAPCEQPTLHLSPVENHYKCNPTSRELPLQVNPQTAVCLQQCVRTQHTLTHGFPL
jgi:hypothetical protein